MKKLLEEPAFYIVAYIIGAFITFGNAYHRTPDTEIHKFAGTEYTVTNGPGTKASGAVIASIFWPLYWSVQVQR